MSLNLGSLRAKAATAAKSVGKSTAQTLVSATGEGKAAAKPAAKADDGSWSETARIVVHALLIAFVVRVFLYQPFNIPSGSMKSNLLVGDFLFVSKLSYGYSTHTFPQSLDIPWTSISIPLRPQKLFSGRIMASEPKRGDVAVFKQPTNVSIDFIKRVIGMPGDEIQVIHGILYINGQPIPKKRIDDFVAVDDDGTTKASPRFEETLPNGVRYTVLDTVDEGPADNTRIFKVPAGHYFMMGDNRDNSTDSRFPSVGYVPFENFVGRADLIFFSAAIDEPGNCRRFAPWTWPTCVRFRRLLSFVR
jgi:signal peptidase I